METYPAVAAVRTSSRALRKVYVSGTGAYVPERRLTNHDLERMVDTSDAWITQRTGIRERRIAGEDEATSDLATEAGARALKEAGIGPTDVGALILCTFTPDTLLPASACYVQERLGLRNACAFDLLAACTGFVYGLVVGRNFIATGMYDHVLVIGAETLSRFVDFTDRNTCILFGDGAGAMVLSANGSGSGSDLIDCQLRSDGAGWDLILLPGGGSRTPPSARSLADGQHYLRMRGQDVYKFAVSRMTEMVEDAVKRNGIRYEDISLVVPHQVNYRIIDASLRKLGIPADRVYLNLERYGNTSAASVPIALDEAVREGRVHRGDIVLFVAFGGGLTWGYALLRW